MTEIPLGQFPRLCPFCGQRTIIGHGQRLTSVPIGGYRDGFGNWCTRIVAPGGRIRIKTDALIRDTGKPDRVVPDAGQHAVQDLPEETLPSC